MILYTNLPIHTPHTTVQRAGQVETAQDNIEIKLDSGALTTLLTRQLPVGFVLQDITLKITEQDNLLCTAQIKPSQLSLPRAAQVLLPDSCALQALISVGYADQRIVLQPISLQIGGLKIPHTLLNPVANELENAIIEGIGAQGIQIHSLKLAEQHLYIGISTE